MTTQRYPILSTERHLTAAAIALADSCKTMRTIYARTGTPPLRDYSADFAGLAKIVTGQQLSAASAAAIWTRVAAALDPFNAATLRAMPDTVLAALGLSAAKIRTLKAVATAIEDDGFDIDALAQAPDALVIEALTALHGIGPWTAEIYLLFALRRADAFPSGDLALQLTVQRLFKLQDRPTPAQLQALSERWRPWRGAAARLLWADYAQHRAAARTEPVRAKATSRPHNSAKTSR